MTQEPTNESDSFGFDPIQRRDATARRSTGWSSSAPAVPASRPCARAGRAAWVARTSNSTLIHWLPGWVRRTAPQFRAERQPGDRGTKWVVDGNYTSVRDLIWPRATTIIWLELQLSDHLLAGLAADGQRIVDARNHSQRQPGNDPRGILFARRRALAWVVRPLSAAQTRVFRPSSLPADHEQARVIVFKRPRDAERFLAETCPAASD